MSTKSVLGGGVEWLCHCPRGCLQKVSWGLSGYVSVLGGVYKKCLGGGLSGYVTVLGGVYKKCLGGVGWLCHCPRGCLAALCGCNRRKALN